MEDQVIKYLPLVEKVVARITVKSSDYDYEDLFNTGVIGLIDALKKFDPQKKVPLKVMLMYGSVGPSLMRSAVTVGCLVINLTI